MKAHTHSLARLVALILLAAILTGCAGQPAASPTSAVPTASANDPSMTPDAPATSTPLPSATPTSTPKPTATSTPAPSATPPGYYRHNDLGFSLTYPANWTIAEEDQQHLSIMDRTSGMAMIANTVVETKAESAEELKTSFLSQMDASYTPTLKESKEITIGENLPASSLVISTKIQGQELNWWIVYAFSNNRGYFFTFLARPDVMAARRETLTRILDSVEVFAPALYGLDRAETLVQLGGDPQREELDPAVTETSAADYAGLLFAGLVRLTPDLKIEPELAEEINVSEDGTVYTFKLREGIQYASGQPIKAEDFKKSWERAADPATRSPVAKTYLGDILGFKDRLDGKAKEISGVKVVDERTLEVTLDGPKPYFLAKLTYPTSFVVQPHDPTSGNSDWMFKPDASGPYIVREYKKNDHIVFERNPNYYNPPQIKYLAFQFVPGGAPMSLFEAGLIDVTGVYAEDAARVHDSKDPLNRLLLTAPSLCTSMLLIDSTKPPLDDPNLRKALALAVNKAGLNEQLSNNRSLIAQTILPPAMPGFQQGLTSAAYDEKAAKEALAASGYAGKPVKITLSAAGTAKSNRKEVAVLADTWKKVLGIEVGVDLVDPDKHVEILRKQHGNVVIFGWCADYPDPENFLDVIFHTGSDFNLANYNNTQIDALLEQARTELDPGKRVQLYQQVEKMLLDQNLVIPTSHGVMELLVSARVKGYVLSPLHARILPELRLEPGK